MHRATPANSSFRGYVAGGARTTIPEVDDSKQMQESKGNFMANEQRSAIEAPQNYGFSSVVRAATKDAMGKIQQSAEGFVSFMGGNRSFPVMGIMDDRRFRPMGLKQGENSQYDDLGQMTLIRRAGLYLLSLDSPDDSQQQSSSAAPAGKDTSGSSSSQNVERFVSVRHVEKQKQQRKMSGGGAQGGGSSTGGSSGGSSQDFKHEGDSVNNEMRVTKKRIEFRSGDTVVGYYDKASATWCFIGKVKLGTESASNPAYGVNGGVGMTSDPSGSDAVLINAPKPGPPTSQDTVP
jgi:phage gp45-like